MRIECKYCGGDSLNHKHGCPLMAKVSPKKRDFKKDFFGEVPNVFVGRYGYPDVNVGMLGVEEYRNHDNPLLWSRENYGIKEIIDLRTSLVNSSFKANIKSFSDRFMEMSQEISMASQPVDVEINLDKEPATSISLQDYRMPLGPRAILKKASITENPKIPTKIDKVVSDTDLKAVDALDILSKREYDEHYLTRLLSAGNLGVGKQRKLVPTRFSITAIDDILGKGLIQTIKQHNQLNYSVFFGSYLGNYYLILCFPEIWTYELFETSVVSGKYATDHEGYNGRKVYAHETAGGYYAARLAILEGLKRIKRQASVLCLRFITEDYFAPLGVWVVRESARKAMANKPLEFSTKDLMLKYAKALVKKKFNLNLDFILTRSILLKNIRQQSKLSQFL